jgi:4,5-dihydroxyphthalate decarboxylase
MTVMTTYPSSGPVKLRTNLADSPTSHALKTGQVRAALAEFDFAGPKLAHDGFKPMVRDGAFDGGELAIVTFLQAKIYGKPLVLLPATMVGRFQHHCIGYNADRGELKPRDIEGRRVAVRSYTQTTGVWVRGILKNDYGVDLDRVTWLCQDDGHLAEYRDPPNVERTPPGPKKVPQMLLDGDVDVAILGADMPKDPKIKPLIANPHEAAKRWYEKHKAVPLNHLFVVSSQLSKARPDVVRDIFQALAASKKAAGPTSGVDTLPFGYEGVRKGLELAIQYAYEQKIIPRMLEVDELFDDTTRHLEA